MHIEHCSRKNTCPYVTYNSNECLQIKRKIKLGNDIEIPGIECFK